ncbi:glycosyltransferase family 2 protein [Methylobacterium haplocladii]|nr:hypothetical protein [Methylobacterium haplocladii]GJD84140.1 hypothetical protein HPGCJGGD_2015 [Methylobacterium haplocladii]
MLQDDLMFAYFVTANRFDRLKNSLIEQIKIGIGIARQSYLITDCRPASMPKTIVDFFGDRIVAEDPYVLDDSGNRSFSFSKLRNSAIKTARASKASWMFFCDADTVLAKIILPRPGEYYTIPYVYWQKTEKETINQSLKEIESIGAAAFSEGNSWFVLHRNVFDALDFNEQIFGYGWEDLEFSVRVQAKGFVPGRCGTHIIHLYHTQEDRQVDWPQFYRNQAVFEAIQIQVQNGYVPDWRNSETLKTSHSAWVADLYFDYTGNIVVNPLSKTANRFDIVDGKFVIHWNDWPAEVFERDIEGLAYIGPLVISPTTI